MPPVLAACLFGAFMLWVFYRDSERRTLVSAGLWIPAFWLALLASKPLSLWFGNGDVSMGVSDYLEAHPLDRNVSIAVMVCGIIILARRGLNWGLLLSRNRCLVVFYVYLLLSLAWSDMPLVAAKRYIRELGTVVMVLVILTERDPVEAATQTFARWAYVLIPLSVLFVKYFPEFGVYYDYWTYKGYCCGVASEKNGLGRIAMVSGLVMLWRLSTMQRASGWSQTIRQGLPDLVVLVMCIWLLQVAHSATSLACFGLGVISLFGSRWLQNRPRLLVGAAWGVICMSFLLLTVSDFREMATGSLGRKSDLTERTVIWEQALKLGTNPVIGAGFGSVWLSGNGRQLAEEWVLPHAHNGYLETYLNSGVIGLGLLLGVLFIAGRNALLDVMAGKPAGYLYTALFLSGFVYNYTETALNNSNPVAFMMLLLAAEYQSSDEFQPTGLDETAEVTDEMQQAWSAEHGLGGVDG